jgi:hypothetical protein
MCNFFKKFYHNKLVVKMSDKKGHSEADMSLLRKKSTRKKKPIPHLEKNFDIKKFRDKIFNQLATEQM